MKVKFVLIAMCSDGSFEKRAIADFISENKLPLVIPFSRETASVIFDGVVTKQVNCFCFCICFPVSDFKISETHRVWWGR